MKISKLHNIITFPNNNKKAELWLLENLYLDGE